ncbi:MAG: CPBP family intramembrane metalloprotease [Fibrobacter sp.]|nr:CPBP family intramembrane metalloprotease [Fibrobacter sp.]
MAKTLKKIHTIELIIILSIIIPPAAIALFSHQLSRMSFSFLAVSTITRDLGYLLLILFLQWRGNEPFSTIGLNFKKTGDEILAGGFLFFPVYFLSVFIQKALAEFGLLVPHITVPAIYENRTIYQQILAIMLIFVVAITEETIFRGYIYQRLQEILANKALAVFFSAILFASGHSYQGIAGVIITGFLGLSLSLIFLWRGSLITPIVIHILYDYIGFFIFPTR